MAFFEDGNYMGEDPTCFFEPEDESTICEYEAETNKNFKRYAFMAQHAGTRLVKEEKVDSERPEKAEVTEEKIPVPGD
jgi:hypothetical protein